MSRLCLVVVLLGLSMVLGGCGQVAEKRVTSYRLIRASCGVMSKKVNEAILEGWQPIGGLSGVTHDCVQALVKTDT